MRRFGSGKHHIESEASLVALAWTVKQAMKIEVMGT